MSAADDFLKQSGAQPQAKPLTSAQQFMAQAQGPQAAQQADGQPAAPQSDWPIAAGIINGISNFGRGVVRGINDPIDGAAQLLSNGAASATHWAAPGSTADKFMRGIADDVNMTNTRDQADYQAATPGSVAAGFGRVGGNIAVPLNGVSAARGATLGTKLSAGVTTGAVVGASQPVYDSDGSVSSDYWGDKAKQIAIGSALGGGVSGLSSAIGAGMKALRPAVAPAAAAGDRILDGLTRAAEGDPLRRPVPAPTSNLPPVHGPTPTSAPTPAPLPAPTPAPLPAPTPAPLPAPVEDLSNLTGSRAPRDVLARLLAARPYVEGSLPTTAQVAGVPELVMAEKVLRNNPAYRGAFEDRAIANNRARLAQLLSVSRTPAELDTAIAARGAETRPMYEAANAATLTVGDGLQELLNRPAMRQAITRGARLASERGENVSPSVATPATTITSSILDVSGNPIVSAVPAQAGTISGNMLQYAKMGLDDLMSTGHTQGIGSHEARALEDTQTALRQWTERNSPEFLAANRAYATASRPINTMQAAQALHDGLSTGTQNAAGDVSPMLSQYRTQLARALRLSPQGIEPDAQQSLEAIQRDLQRETISHSIRSSGSDTFFNAQAPNWLSGQLFGNAMDGNSALGRIGAGIGGFMTGGTMGAAGGALGAQRVGEFVGNRVNNEFQHAMLDPSHFARLLSEALDRQTGGSTLGQQLAPVGTRAAAGGAQNFTSPGPGP